jgi:hypothetical protein
LFQKAKPPYSGGGITDSVVSFPLPEEDPTSLEFTESIGTRIRDPTPIHTSHTASIYLRIQKTAETNTEIITGSDHS